MSERTPLEDLAEQSARIKEMQSHVPALVVQAHLAGDSWSAIGRALGVSKSEAYRKYAPVTAALNKAGTAGTAG